MRAKRFSFTCPLLVVLSLPPGRAAAEPQPASPGPAPSSPVQADSQEPPAPEPDKDKDKPPSPAPPGPAPEGTEGIQEKLQGVQDIEDVDLADLLSGAISVGGEGRSYEDSPVFVSVVTEEDIRRLGARTLEDVLETLAGFEVLTDNLGRGRVVVRGMAAAPGSEGSDGVLILLNGHRLNDGIRGATAVNLDLPVDNIKRIEVRRGPGSILDGPGAFLAVINVVTETADTFRKDELSVGGGSFSTLHYNFRYGTTFRGISLAGFLQFSRTQGAGLEVPEDAQTLADRQAALRGRPPISRAPGPVDDDRKSVDANLAVVYKDLTVNGRLKEENAGGFLGIVDALGRQNRLSNKQVVVDADYRHGLGEKGSLRGRVSFAQSQMAESLDVLPPGFTLELPNDQTFIFQTGVFFQRNLNSRRLAGELLFERRLFDGNSLNAGLSLEGESTFSLRALSNLDVISRTPLSSFQSIPEIVPHVERQIFSGFVEDSWSRGRAGFVAGLRVDDYRDATTAVSPHAGFVYRLPRGVNLKLGYGRSTRMPTFAERFFSSPAIVANPALDPETLDMLEGGFNWHHRNLRVTASAYRGFLRNAIVPLPPAFPTGQRFLVNRPGTDTSGLEFTLHYTSGPSRLFHLTYAWQRAEDTRTGARTADVPSHLAALGGALGVGPRLIVAPELIVRGSRPRAPGDPRPPPDSYILANATVRVRTLNRGLELSVSLQNLFDRRYFDPAPAGSFPGDYPRPGRSVFVKARYKF